MATSIGVIPETVLALQGGAKAVTSDPGDLFTWPIITPEDEAAVLAVLRTGKMSGIEITKEFEKEIAAWHGVQFALGTHNGTAALHAAMWACGVGAGDEVIGPSLTYWASVMPALNLRATIVFADVEAHSLCLDPKDVERRITPRTKAIVPVHFMGHPCEMDALCAIAAKHGVKVIEDVSHAQGGLYKGRKLGAIGDVGAMSLMSGKSLVCGEGGMIITNDRKIYERSVAFGHYERTGVPSRYVSDSSAITDPELARFAGMPLGGFKHRMHQLSSALGRVQLKHYAARIAEIQAAMNRFWDLLEGVPGLRAHRTPQNSGSTMGGWYAAHGLYVPEELHGLPVEKFCEAVRAEGAPCDPGTNSPLHLHAVFHEADIYGEGRPTMSAHTERDVRQGAGSLPVTEAVQARCYSIPWFKHDRPAMIKQYAEAFRKVALAAQSGALRAR